MQRDEDGVSPFFRPCLGHITTATIIMMNHLQAYKQSNFLSSYNQYSKLRGRQRFFKVHLGTALVLTVLLAILTVLYLKVL